MFLTLVLLSLTPNAAVAGPPRDPATTIRVEVGSRTVRVVAGPFTIAGMPPGMDHAGHAMHEMDGHTTPFLTFEWPVSGWIHGFQVRLRRGDGRPLDRALIHHVNMMNFGRRQLLYDAVERMLAAGKETDDVRFPRLVGLPMSAGESVGIYAAWANPSEEEISEVFLEVTFPFSNRNLSPRPLDALVLYMDVNYPGPGATDSYDLPPGYSTKSDEFTMPIDGRLLVAGGHLHDHARYIELEDLETGRVIVRLEARLDPEGRLLGVERRLFGVRGDGLRLRAGRRYRLTAAYDNPTGGTIPLGAMGIMAGLFVPASLSAWPAIDPDHPEIKADIKAILSIGAAAGHQHHER